MSKIKENWELIVAVLLILVVITWALLNRPSEKYFNKVELSKDNYILNKTALPYIDTLILVGLDELKIKNTIVFVRHLTVESDDDEFILKAHIVAGYNRQFLIEIEHSDRSDITESVAHELIHLHQMYTGKLRVTHDYVLWKGDTLRNLPEYSDREWEQEAVGLGKILELRMNKKLYGDK